MKNNIVALEKAVSILKEGGNVIFPTETVYGLGALATNDIACRRIFELKKRPKNNPLIVHVSSIEMAKEIAKFSEVIYDFLEHFWPGPFTVVLPLKKNGKYNISKYVTNNLDTIAIRIPKDPLALELLKQVNAPIAAPSANLSGYISPTRFYHIFQSISEKAPILFEEKYQSYHCDYGLESTIVDFTEFQQYNKITILRAGAITKEEINESIKKLVKKLTNKSSINLKPIILDKKIEPKIDEKLKQLLDEVKNNQLNQNIQTEKEKKEKEEKINSYLQKMKFKSPGQLYKHYSPHSPIRMDVEKPLKNELIIDFAVPLRRLDENKNDEMTNLNLSPNGSLKEAARNLFDMIYIADQLVQKNAHIYKSIGVAKIPNKSIGIAINDKLKRACM